MLLEKALVKVAGNSLAECERTRQGVILEGSFLWDGLFNMCKLTNWNLSRSDQRLYNHNFTVTADASGALHVTATSMVSQHCCYSRCRYSEGRGSCVKESQSESNHWPSTTVIGLITVCQMQLAGLCYTILEQKTDPVQFHLLHWVTLRKAIVKKNGLKHQNWIHYTVISHDIIQSAKQLYY